MDPCTHQATAGAAPQVEDAPSTGGHIMFSGRFNNPEIIAYMKVLKGRLDERGLRTFMVQEGASGDFADATCTGLYRAKVMVCFCTDEYGAMTGAGYETYVELRYAHQKHFCLFPIKMGKKYPPEPKDEKGRAQNSLVFHKGLVWIDDTEMKDARGVADTIANAIFEQPELAESLRI